MPPTVSRAEADSEGDEDAEGEGDSISPEDPGGVFSLHAARPTTATNPTASKQTPPRGCMPEFPSPECSQQRGFVDENRTVRVAHSPRCSRASGRPPWPKLQERVSDRLRRGAVA